MKGQAIIGAIYLVSSLPIFWIDTPIGKLRFFLWFAPILMIPMYRRRAPPKLQANGHIP